MIVRMIEGHAPAKRARSRSLLCEQFQECRPAAAAHSAARAGQRLQEGSRVRHRFSPPPYSAGLRRRTVPAPEDPHRRALHRARKRIDGRFHPPHRPRTVRARPHAGRRRRPAGNFPRARWRNGSHRRNSQDGAGGQTRKHRRRRARAKIRSVPSGIHGRVPQDSFAFARTSQRNELPRAGSRLRSGGRRHRRAEGKISQHPDRGISRGSPPPHSR